MEGVEVVCVKQLIRYQACLNCKAKIPVEGEQDDIVKCEKCGNFQMTGNDPVKLMAKMLVMKADTSTKTLVAFEDILKEITRGGEISSENLLKAGMFNATYNRFNVVTGIS